MSSHKVSHTQADALDRLDSMGVIRDGDGVSVATVGSLKSRGLCAVHPVFHEELNFLTARVSRRAGWFAVLTPAGVEFAAMLVNDLGGDNA